MSPVENAAALLPSWVGWGNLVFLPCAFVLSFLCAWLSSHIALRPLRKTPPDLWVERARLTYPVQLVSLTNTLILPVFFAVLALMRFAGPLSYMPPKAFAFLAGFAAWAG